MYAQDCWYLIFNLQQCLLMSAANDLTRLRQGLEGVSRDLQEKQNQHQLTVVKTNTLHDAIERERAGTCLYLSCKSLSWRVIFYC